jgi:hypothetical protein
MNFDLRRLVRAPKANISIGRWAFGKVPRSDFHIAKSAYGLGNAYRWCVISFTTTIDGNEIPCKVLVVVHFGKQKFEAILGVGLSGPMRILCSYEYHASEPGWHVHAACDPVSKVPLGYMRGPWVRRLPHAKKPHSRQEFNIENETMAQRVAFKCYGIEAKGSLL